MPPSGRYNDVDKFLVIKYSRLNCQGSALMGVISCDFCALDHFANG